MKAPQFSAQERAAARQYAARLAQGECPVRERFLAAEWAALDAPTRLAIRNHTAECPVCQVERNLANSFDNVDADAPHIAQLAAKLAARLPAQFDAPATTASGRRWHGAMAAGVAVCAAGLGFLVLNRGGDLPDLPAPTDASSITRGAGIRLLPIDTRTAASAVLRWSAVRAATQYRVTATDVSGNVLWEQTTADTQLTPPSGVGLKVSKLYWDVQAFDAGGRLLARSNQGVYSFDEGVTP